MEEREIDHPTLWDATQTPAPDVDEFKEFLNCQRAEGFQPDPDQCRFWDNPPITKTSSSFGENGTTATVNAYGDIVQFGTFIGKGHSGMFSADHAYLSEPYMVDDRTRELQELATSDFSDIPTTYRFLLHLSSPFEDPPRQTWVNYRWPRYEFKDESKEMVLQWVVRDNVILRHCTLTNLGSEDLVVPFEFTSSSVSMMQIRDMDHVDPKYDFNEIHDDAHPIQYGPHGYSWILTQKLQPQKPFEALGQEISGGNTSLDNHRATSDELDSVAVVVSIFLNGKAVNWADLDQWNISIAGSKKRSAMSNISNWLSPDLTNVAEVVIAYKMILLPASKAYWKDFLIPAAYTNVGDYIGREPRPTMFLSLLSGPINDDGEHHNDVNDKDKSYSIQGATSSAKLEGRSGRLERNETMKPENPSGTPERSSPEYHIEYLVRRNLEHILSVCSIPLRRPKLESDSFVHDSRVPVALTCGDMSFHRITASSSYFAFQFLLDIARRVKQSKFNSNSYAQWLLERIAFVCKGHLQWISDNAERLRIGIFAANYWVTGKIIRQVSRSWRPADSLTDSPFQIIKAGNHARVFTEDKEISAAIIRTIYSPWLEHLDEIDQRHRFAWPHAQESDINVFRLDDHLWIWKALKIFDELGLWKTPAQNQLKSTDAYVSPEDIAKLKKWARTYGYRNVQREMLRRFTTESDVSRKRMLAVFRSPRETRFLFHARDTALFYEYEDFLLPETSFRQVWENTIESQKHHDENQETRWDNALRYALAIVMGTAGYSINKEKRPAILVNSSLNILLKSSSSNGLLAGQLDETTKEPVLFYREADRDFYYHASFEIPYILLTKANMIKELPNNHKNDRQGDILHDDIAEFSERLTAQPKHQAMAHGLEGSAFLPSESISAIQGKAITKINQVAQQSQTLKKSMPFNRFIDSNSIVEIAEEWLYNYPTFLSQDNALSPINVEERLARYVIESIGLRSITGLIRHDGELAASFIDSDAELRNDLGGFIANFDHQLCLELLEDSENWKMRRRIYEALNIPMSETTREFLATGKMPAQVGAVSSVHGSETASTVSSEVADHKPDTHVMHFLRKPYVRDVLEKALKEHRGDLLRIVKINERARHDLEWLLNGELGTVARIFLNNRYLFEKVPKLHRNQQDHDRHVVLQAAMVYLDGTHRRRGPDQEANGDLWKFSPGKFDIALVDTRKKRTQGKRGKSDSDTELVWLSNIVLWEQYLNMPRTAESAKKRIIYLPKANLEAALICFLGSPELERPPISLFFDRHRNYDLYFFDDTTMSLNTWETELHLSFYQLATSREIDLAIGIPDVRKDTLPGGKGIQITKASMGFRFFGDFFDRYWTCHFVEFIPANSDIPEWDVSIQFNSKERAWRQRKVLELILFDRILGSLVSSTKKIIERIKYELGVRHGAFSFVNLQSDDYFSSSDHWQESQQALQAIEDHLEHVIVNVAKWETREKDRGMERPRWTRNDEWKYRGDLKKLLASNNSKLRDMHSLHTEIKTLKEFLMSRQDQIRNDLSLRGAENIRFFTYVTVVFLPLGFAASVFSMSEIPDNSLIWQMASTSIIALVLTVLALINAETLGAVAGAISRTIAHYSDERMRGSYLLRPYRLARREERISLDDYEQAASIRDLSPASVTFRPRSNPDKSPSQRANPGDKNNWHIWFWIVYGLIELPASRAALGYAALRAKKPTLTAFFNIFLGILIFPWCLIVWLLQVVVLNLIDLVRLIIYFSRNLFAGSSRNDDPFYGNTILLLRPDTTMRPFLNASLKLREKRKTSKDMAQPPQNEQGH